MTNNQTGFSDFTIKHILLLLVLSIPIAIVSSYFPNIAIAAAILTTGGVAVIWSSTRWPETFLILALWTNFMKSAYIPGLAIGEFGATPFMVFTVLAAVGFGFQIVSGRRHLVLPVGLGFLLLFVAFTTLSLIVAQNLRLAVGAYTRQVLDWIIFFLLVQMLINQDKVRKLMTALLVQAAFVIGWGLFAGISLEMSGAPRQSLFFWQQFQKNDFAAYLGIVLVLALATFILTKVWYKKLLALLLLLSVPLSWMFTFSRGGFLAIVACLTIFLALERNKRLLQRSFMIIIVTGLLALGFITFSSSTAKNLAVDGLQSIVTGDSEAERHIYTIAFRLELARAAVEVFAEHPILGVGFNQWQFYSPITTQVYDPQTKEIRETGYSIHNRLLLIAVNSGLLTLIAYVGFLVVTLIHSLHMRGFANFYTRTYLHAFIAAVIGMQVALLFAPTVLWEWPALGILAGITNVIKIEKRNNLPDELRF